MAKIKKSVDGSTSASQPAHIPEVDEIDLGAALPPGPPPKRGRGRPRSAAPKPPNSNRKVRKDKGIKKTPKSPYIDNNILVDNNKIIGVGDIDNSDNGDYQSAKDLKGEMTLNELKFLGLYVSGNISRIKAMKSAGFVSANDSYLYLLAKKIIEKYESRIDDHRKVARAIGAGEVFIIKTLYSLAKDSKSEKIRGENAMNLAKIIGMTKEQLEGAGGVTIIFEGSGTPGAPASLPGAPPMPPNQGEIKVIPASNKPMMITK